MSNPQLSLLQARVLGVLVEKQHTVPDTYPLSLNALTAGCNQKSSRDPVIEVTERDVQAAVDELRAASLVIESSGGRVMRYAHNVERVLDVARPAAALLAVLMLRGPQTAGELRINSDRLHRFADISAVEGYLQELAQRPTGALVTELPRAAGTRETRWTHLLSGPPPAGEAAAPAREPVRGTANDPLRPSVPLQDPVHATTPAQGPEHTSASLEERVDALEREVAMLKRALEALQAEGGAAS
jgi:uncharacterized protein YceH (UPF0502 family)